MSTTIQVDPALADALSAAADSFPIADLERMPANVVTDVAASFPEGGGRWVAATFTGDRAGSVAVVVSFDVASGLFDTEGNAPKLVAVATAAAAKLGVTLGDPTTGRGPEGLPFPERATTCAVALHSAGEHVVTLFVSIEDDSAGTDAASFPPLGDAAPATVPAPAAPALTADARALKVIRSVEMNVTAELGRAQMTVRELLELAPGSVIELDRAAGSPVDLLVNGTIIARGEVVVIDEEYGIRVSEIVGSPEDL